MINQAPPRLPIPSRIKLQERIYGFASISLFLAVFSFFLGAGEGVFGFCLLSACGFIVGSKIKTHRDARGQIKIY